MVRDLEKENKELRKLLDKAEIPYANKNTFSENIVDLEEDETNTLEDFGYWCRQIPEPTV